MLEGACKVRAMHTGCARQLIDARARGILEQTLARLREPIRRRAAQRFALYVGDQVLNDTPEEVARFTPILVA